MPRCAQVVMEDKSRGRQIAEISRRARRGEKQEGQTSDDRLLTTEKGRMMSERIESYRDLDVYKLAFKVQQEVFELSNGFPRDEKYSLTDQIRRSSRSIGGNIAEAWAKRRYAAHFVSKLSDADGEQMETQHWLDTSKACGYVSMEKQEALIEKYRLIGKMLGRMMQAPEKWCGRFDKE